MSKRHPSSRRRPKGGDHPDDAFVSTTLQFGDWARDNSGALIVAVAIVAALLWGIVYYVGRRDELRAQASQELEAIHQTVGMGDREAAKQELGRFLDRFGDTRLALEARILLAEQYLRTGETAQAISALEPATESLGTPLSIQAGFLLASAYEEDGQPQRAEETYLRLAERADLQFQMREALADAARIRASRGDHEAAAELYRRILDTFEEGEQGRTVYEMRLAEVETAASTASPAGSSPGDGGA